MRFLIAIYFVIGAYFVILIGVYFVIGVHTSWSHWSKAGTLGTEPCKTGTNQWFWRYLLGHGKTVPGKLGLLVTPSNPFSWTLHRQT